MEGLSSTSAEVQLEILTQEPSAAPPAVSQASRTNLITFHTTDKRPLSIIKSKQIDSQFRKLIHLLCPIYSIPTRKTVSSSLVPICYNEVKT